MSAVASPGDGTPGADVAVAGALISSTATVSVAGSTSIAASGDLTISATNLVAASASGDASAATGGARVGTGEGTQPEWPSRTGAATALAPATDPCRAWCCAL